MEIIPKETQETFLLKMLRHEVIEALYAGTAGTGKSFWIAAVVSGLCLEFPNTRWGVFRKDLSTARKTIWHTYIKVLDTLEVAYESVKGHEPAIRFPNGSSIEFFGLDQSKDPDYNKVKGLELSGSHIDEANEVEYEGANIVNSRIGRWNSNGVPAKMLYTCNPSQGWVRDYFRDPAQKNELPPNRVFVESNSSELEDSYRKILESLPPKQRERYLENNWDYIDDPDRLILYEWIRQNPTEPNKAATHFGVDFARSRDKSILAYRHKTEESDEIPYIENIQVSPDQVIATADMLINRVNEYGVPHSNVIGDIVGLGAGPMDYAKAQGYKFVEYNGGLPADIKYSNILVGGVEKKIQSALQFKNKRSQDYWNFRELLRTGKLKIVQNEDLIKQAIEVKYIVKDKYIEVEPKKELKKRLGRSPDELDACVMVCANMDSNKISFVI